MATGTRQTYYYRTLEAMQKIAKEEHYDLNGSSLEDIFWHYYLGEDDNLRNITKEYYLGNTGIKETLKNLIELHAYNDLYMRYKAVDLIKIIRDALTASNWVSENAPYDPIQGDYSLSNKHKYLANIYEIYGYILDDISMNKRLADSPSFMEQKLNPWDIGAGDKRRKNILGDPESYSIAYLTSTSLKYHQLQEQIEKNNPLPSDILTQIIDNWDNYYLYTSIYETLECCLVLADTVQENPLTRVALRNYSKDLSALISKPNLIMDTDLSKLSRLIAYADLTDSLHK